MQPTRARDEKAIALSETAVLNEREFELLTAAPDVHGQRTDLTSSSRGTKFGGQSKVKRLRAINRAPALIRKLYVEGLVSAKLAEKMGPAAVIQALGTDAHRAGP